MSSIFKQVEVYFKSRVKDWWSQIAAKNKSTKKIKVFAALIKENTTVPLEHPEYRFQIISFAVGTKYQSHCTKAISVHSCDGHAESLCYYATHVYFQMQLKKLKVTREGSLFYSTEDGFIIKPHYKFLLLVSRPPCGFLSDDKKHLLSWKMPFKQQPHIPECSSRILINSYLGIQGPLTILLTKPIYITDVIILNYDELHVKDCKPTNFAVFNNIQGIETSLEKIETTLMTLEQRQAPNIFHFHKPKITTYQVKSKDLYKIFERDLCDFTLNQADTSKSCFFSTPMEINEGQKIFTMTIDDKTFNADKEEKKNMQKLWEDITKLFVMESKLIPQFNVRFNNTLEALKTLSLALEIEKSIEKAKVELKERIGHREKKMKDNVATVNEKVESICLSQNENDNIKDLADICKSIPEEAQERNDDKATLSILEGLKVEEGQFFDCAWNKYWLLMKNAVEHCKPHS